MGDKCPSAILILQNIFFLGFEKWLKVNGWNLVWVGAWDQIDIYIYIYIERERERERAYH